MNIHGLQKMTLLDFPGHVACTVFLAGCDMRCPFCHNYDLACGKSDFVMSDAELIDFLVKRKGLLEGVAFTGGEPCLHKDLPDLIRRIRDLGFAVKLDTNGCHPDLLRDILREGLIEYAAMDIKNSPGKYALTCGLQELDLNPVLESISILLESRIDYEFRTTVVREFHEASDFEEIGAMIQGARHYFLQSFTDRDTVPFEGFHAPSAGEMLEFADIVRPYVDDVRLRGVENASEE